MPCSFKVARTDLEKDKAYRLRHKVFVEEEKRFETQMGKICDVYDDLRETLCIIAECDGEPVGTIRVTMDNPVGLPPCKYYDFTPYLSKLKGGVVGVSWLCIVGKYRLRRGLLPGLFKTMVREVRKMGGVHLIATLHPAVFPLLKAFGAVEVGDVFHSEELDVPMVPIHLELDKLPNGVREMSQDPLHMLFEDSNERRIYTRKEKLVKQGEIGTEAFLIMRGSVKVLLDRDCVNIPAELERPLLGPGQIFGELALLDQGPRTATVVCHSREVDTMIFRREEFLDQLQKDQATSYEICRILGLRLRYLLRQKDNPQQQESLAARILLDGSQEGQTPVAMKFLAEQCGLKKKEMIQFLREWEEEQVVVFTDDSLVEITDVDKFKEILLDEHTPGSLA